MVAADSRPSSKERSSAGMARAARSASLSTPAARRNHPRPLASAASPSASRRNWPLGSRRSAQDRGASAATPTECLVMWTSERRGPPRTQRVLAARRVRRRSCGSKAARRRVAEGGLGYEQRAASARCGPYWRAFASSHKGSATACVRPRRQGAAPLADRIDLPAKSSSLTPSLRRASTRRRSSANAVTRRAMSTTAPASALIPKAAALRPSTAATRAVASAAPDKCRLVSTSSQLRFEVTWERCGSICRTAAALDLASNSGYVASPCSWSSSASARSSSSCRPAQMRSCARTRDSATDTRWARSATAMCRTRPGAAFAPRRSRSALVKAASDSARRSSRAATSA